MMQKNYSAPIPNNAKNWQRTNKQKKFLKKPKNKTAKKQYFRELEQGLREEPDSVEKLVKNDLETIAKILEFADISKQLDLKLLGMLLDALWGSINKDEDIVETFYNLAHHNILVMLFKMLKVLKENVLTYYNNPQITLLSDVLHFFTLSLGLKRLQKLLRHTEGFETISQPDFWEPIYFSPKLQNKVKVSSLWFSIRISRQKLFKEKFLKNFVAIAREVLSELHDEIWPIAQVVQQSLQGISHSILESEQREYFLKLVSDLPEKSLLIPSELAVEAIKCSRMVGSAYALVKCANCGVSEKSKRQFQKCSRCGFVFYCSKTCQKTDWRNHKQICKEIRK